MEVLVILLVMVAVIAVAGLLFCVWAVAAVLRGSARVVRRSVRKVIRPKHRRSFKEPAGQGCGNRDCLCANPPYARFCRRCGRPLPALLRLAGSKAA
ncbi:MAG TPA: hypothetical protein VF595_03435 [Tepidisphaeraceae bacterium]|jgi:hypothetical protein